MAITTVYVVTKEEEKGIWTENAVCLTAGEINPEPGTGQRHWRPVRGDLPGHVARSAGNLIQNYCSGRSRSGSWPTPSSDCRRFSELLFYSHLACLRCEKYW